MPTLVAIERRVARLEARAPTQRSTPRRDSLPPLSPEAMRVVLKMLVEMGALIPPPLGHPDRWQELRLALFGPGPLASNDDQEAIEWPSMAMTPTYERGASHIRLPQESGS